MGNPERIFSVATDLIRSAADNGSPHALRRYRRGRRTLIKFAKVGALMLLTAIVIPVAMITAGLLFGPRGVEGLIAAPLTLLATWGAILFFAFRRPRASRRGIAKADLGQLPAQTEEWLEHQRPKLPATTQAQIDAIALRLEAIAPQLQGLDPQLVEAHEARRLIAEELPELVQGFQKVPLALQRKPLHDGPSPEQRLIEGLSTIDEQLGRLQGQLAQGDLHTLATHQRYLELKYKNDDEK